MVPCLDMTIPGFVLCESQAGGISSPLHLRFADAPIPSMGADALCGVLVGWDQPGTVDIGLLPSNVCTVCAQTAHASVRRYVRS